MSTANVRINIVTRRVRVSSDGTRTVIAPRRHAKWIAAAMVAVGPLQAAYGVWASRSDAAAAERYHLSKSCEMNAGDSMSSMANAVCRLEPTVVYGRHSHTSRSRAKYYLLTVSQTGTRDVTPLYGSGAKELWERVRPTQRIVLQRFVAPGYHLTGQVMAYSDSVGRSITSYHPDAGTRYSAVMASLGVLLFMTGAALLVSWSRTDAISPSELIASR
jgi:hypothetical protein